MVSDKSDHLLLLAYVTLLMFTEESTVRADPDLAAREADQFFQCLVLVAKPNGFFHLLLLLFLDLGFCLGEAVMEVCRIPVRGSVRVRILFDKTLRLFKVPNILQKRNTDIFWRRRRREVNLTEEFRKRILRGLFDDEIAGLKREFCRQSFLYEA